MRRSSWRRTARPPPPPDVIHWRGEGMQIYSCQTLQGGYAWTLERPDATLTDLLGHVRGHHDGGPSWTAADGSRIVGQLVTAIPAPRPNAIPWLVLRAATHEGHGVLDSVTYVLRTETVGGVAPASGCDPLHAGGGNAGPPIRRTIPS
ncbi:MAG: DUF3455 domain-containing protein [Acetobacteraceae bacterium]